MIDYSLLTVPDGGPITFAFSATSPTETRTGVLVYNTAPNAGGPRDHYIGIMESFEIPPEGGLANVKIMATDAARVAYGLPEHLPTSTDPDFFGPLNHEQACRMFDAVNAAACKRHFQHAQTGFTDQLEGALRRNPPRSAAAPTTPKA